MSESLSKGGDPAGVMRQVAATARKLLGVLSKLSTEDQLVGVCARIRDVLAAEGLAEDAPAAAAG